MVVVFIYVYHSIVLDLMTRRIKLPSTQLVSVTFLIWQHVSTSKGHFLASGIKYIQEIVCSCIEFKIQVSISVVQCILIISSLIIYPTNEKLDCSKRMLTFTLIFTLKVLLHVSV